MKTMDLHEQRDWGGRLLGSQWEDQRTGALRRRLLAAAATVDRREPSHGSADCHDGADVSLRPQPDPWSPTEVIDLTTPDALSLSSHRQVLRSALDSLDATAAVAGETAPAEELAQDLAEALLLPHVALFASGGAALRAAIEAIVGRRGRVLLDCPPGAALARGAEAVTRQVERADLRDPIALRRRLADLRSCYPESGVLVVTEGLCSRRADSPDLQALQATCSDHDASLLVDVSGDFATTGPAGTGVLGEQDMLGKVDFVTGSLAALASSGRFVASGWRAPECIRETAIPGACGPSPVACSLAREALLVARSREGHELRRRLLDLSRALRQALARRGLECLGEPSPIVLLPLASASVARAVAIQCSLAGVLVDVADSSGAELVRTLRMRVRAGQLERRMVRAAEVIAGAVEAATLARALAGAAANGA